MDYLYTLSGFAVGAIVGLTGVGGGSLMTPLLVLLFGVHPATAVGTDLLYAALTKAGGTVAHGRKGHIDWQITGRLAAGSIPAAALTILVLSQLPQGSNTIGALIAHGLGFALLLTAIAILFGRKLRDFAAKRDDSPIRQRHLGKITIAIGVLLGVLVTISSVGAGALGVAALFFLYPRLTPVRIVGSDVAHAVPLTLVAGLGHWWLGSVDWALLGALLLGSLPGIWLGSHLSAKVPEHILRRLLASMLVLIGTKLVLA
ncbi:MAG: sulfite exporter TauE/SafE family protein [Dechloromonas sp.]|nr:sulfite exporter TauE/SafE family protein [Dechloromonas sp.]